MIIRQTKRFPKSTAFLTTVLLFVIGYCVLVTQRLDGVYFQPIPVSPDDWTDFSQDYQQRFGRLPPDTMKEWLRVARFYNCNERDFYNNIEEDLRSFRRQVNRTGLFNYNDVVPSALKETDNYIAFQIDNHEIRTIESRNCHGNFVQQGEIEQNLRWMLQPLKFHRPPLKTIVFFDLHDHPTKNSTAESLPLFTTTKMGYLTDNKPHPTDASEFLAHAFDTTAAAVHEKSQKVDIISPFHPDHADSYDCRSILVPYYFGLRAAHADPYMSKWRYRRDAIVWRGTTTGYDWGKSPRFRLMDKFGGGANLPNPVPKGSNPIAPGVPVDVDFGFVAVVQNYTKDYTMAPNWRMAPFMEPHETREYKYIMDVDGNSFTNRFSTLLRSGSVVFKSTRFREWFSERLQPFVDYVPVDYDLGDFAEKMEWIHNHPEVAERIAQHGKDMSMNHIRDEDIRCYTYRLVLEYATLFQPPDW